MGDKMGIVSLILWLIALACFIWVVYDVLANQKKMAVGMKILWIVLAFLFSIIVAIIYYFAIYKKK